MNMLSYRLYLSALNFRSEPTSSSTTPNPRGVISDFLSDIGMYSLVPILACKLPNVTSRVCVRA
jgi:hypothetical protein